jgi:hypothetical protein
MLNMSDIIGENYDYSDLPDWLDNVATTVVLVDAAMAAEMLIHNIEPQLGVEGTNRRSQPHLVTQFTEIILNGGWQFNHQGVAFSDTGEMIDGAHRLKAIIKAAESVPDIAVPIMVTINVPRESMRDIDVTRRRTLGDRLTMKGLRSATLLAAMARLTYLYEAADFSTPDRRYWANGRPNRNVLEDHVDENRSLMIESSYIGERQKIFTPNAIAASYFIIRKKYPDADLATFFEQIKNGENIGSGDPVFALRRWGINHRATGRMPESFEQMALIFKAYKAFREGRRVDALAYKPNQEIFPRP